MYRLIWALMKTPIQMIQKRPMNRNQKVVHSVQRMKQLTFRYMVRMKLQVQKIHLIRLLLNG